MMKQIFALLLVVGLLVPVMSYAVCGSGTLLCPDCATEELCEAEVSCLWNATTCAYQGSIPVVAGDITEIATTTIGLIDDLMLWVMLVIVKA
ncbi:unnamed protein product, partial [marine sediment metagenome]